MQKTGMIMTLLLGALVCSSCSWTKKKDASSWQRFETAVPMANAGA